MMKFTALYPIQKFRHYGQPFSSSKSAKLLFYGMNYCWFCCSNDVVATPGAQLNPRPACERTGAERCQLSIDRRRRRHLW